MVVLITKQLHITPGWVGLIGASSLLGIFAGAPVFGYLTDRIGRRWLFTLDLAVFLVAGLLQAFAQAGWQLFVLRLILGLAIGAEYAIGAPMLAEFVPARDRGLRLSLLEICWYVGFLASVLIGYGLLALGVHWRGVLATSAVPALVTLILRLGLPESPRWLMSQGRTEEARQIVNRYLGGDAYFNAEDFSGEPQQQAGLGKLFARGVRSRTIFVCTFWACLVAPYFAIFTFAPKVLQSLNLSGDRAGTIAINALAAAGAVAGLFIVERFGRRQMLIGPFWISAAALFTVGFWAHAPASVIVLAFAVYAFFNAVSGDLTAVYPAEVFPTDVRTSGVGLASAASRIGAAIGTWLLPDRDLQHRGQRLHDHRRHYLRHRSAGLPVHGSRNHGANAHQNQPDDGCGACRRPQPQGGLTAPPKPGTSGASVTRPTRKDAPSCPAPSAATPTTPRSSRTSDPMPPRPPARRSWQLAGNRRALTGAECVELRTSLESTPRDLPEAPHRCAPWRWLWT